MKVLIVEDLEVNATYLESLLGIHDIESIIADTGEKALNLVESIESIYSGIGCILLDIGLPGIDGLEVCENLKKNTFTRNIPIIFLTAYKDEEYLRKAFKAGAIDYIVKPYSEIDVVPRVKAHLRSFKLLTETIENNAQLNSNYEEMRQISDVLNSQKEEIEKQSEQLQESEAKYRLLAENLLEIVWQTDLEGNFLYLNNAFYKTFGIEISEAYPKLEDVFTKQTLSKIKTQIKYETEKLEKEGIDDEIVFMELEGVHKNGDIIYLETSADFIFENYQPVAIQGVMRNITEKKKHEKIIEDYRNKLEEKVQTRTAELENNRKELRLIFDHAPVLMMLLNQNREIININKFGLNFTGLTFKELKGKSFGCAFQCINSEITNGKCGHTKACNTCQIRLIIEKTFSSLKEQAKVETIINVLLNNKQTSRITYVSTTILQSINKQTNVLVTIDDITEQKKMEQQIRESEEKYRKLFETKNEAVFFLDAETLKYTDANEAACKLYGYSYHEITQIGPADISLQQEDTDQKLDKLINNKNQKLNVLNRKCRRKDGSKIIVEIQNTVFTYKGKKTIFSTHRDITKRQEALQALKNSENTFRTLVENIDDIFWIFNSEKQIFTYISPKIEDIADISDEVFLKTNGIIQKVIHPTDREMYNKLRPGILKGEKVNFEIRVILKNNSVKWMNVKSFGNYYINDNETHIFGVFADITEKKLAERKVLKAVLETESRERELFAKELHDGLGANLSSIKMLLERINSGEIKQEKKSFYSKQALDYIEEAVVTSKEISNNLKPHLLVNYGLISSIKTLCNKINQIGGMKVNFEFSSEDINFDDETNLAVYRMINELINNSLKYSKASNAEIKLFKENEKIELIYSDNGRGFLPEEVKTAKGNGFKNIASRVKLLEGTVNIESKIDNGMKATISFYNP